VLAINRKFVQAYRIPAWYYSGMPKRSSKSTDPIKSAKRVLDEIIAKHDPESITLEKVKAAEASGKNLAAVALGRLGGLKGGKARARKLSAKTRRAIAMKAASARWSKKA
jgi:hypothetical protein